jgi:putative ABC transport system permease protein
VIRIILLEAAMISGLAGILGYGIGFAATKLLIPFFTEGHGAHVPFDPILAAGAFLLSMLVGLAASGYPALAASRLDPNEALRAL